MKKYIKIYALNMDINEKKILNEQEEIYENNIVDQNRHIPTQIRHFIIEQHEYIIQATMNEIQRDQITMVDISSQFHEIQTI